MVRVTLSSTRADVGQLLLLVEKNPAPLTAAFRLTPELEPVLQTNVKMGESSTVYAVAVTTGGQVLFARKDVKITLGGCG